MQASCMLFKQLWQNSICQQFAACIALKSFCDIFAFSSWPFFTCRIPRGWCNWCICGELHAGSSYDCRMHWRFGHIRITDTLSVAQSVTWHVPAQGVPATVADTRSIPLQENVWAVAPSVFRCSASAWRPLKIPCVEILSVSLSKRFKTFELRFPLRWAWSRLEHPCKKYVSFWLVSKFPLQRCMEYLHNWNNIFVDVMWSKGNHVVWIVDNVEGQRRSDPRNALKIDKRVLAWSAVSPIVPKNMSDPRHIWEVSSFLWLWFLKFAGVLFWETFHACR